MFKKLAIVTIGGVLVVGLLFGRNAWNYAATAWEQVHSSVNESMPIEFQIKAAKKQLKNIEPEMKEMVRKIANEEVGIEKLKFQIAKAETNRDNAYAEVMSLRSHLASGDSQYVHAGVSYSNSRVREELRNQFEILKKQEDTATRLNEVLVHRQRGLNAAQQQLEETASQRRELAVEIENLEAQLKMLRVAETASRISIDDSELSHTRDMIDKIKTRIKVESKVLDMAPQYEGGIPLNSKADYGDIESEVDAYLATDEDHSVAKK